ncbi:SMI1/KNR4 family protein [Flavobacterium eburneipallidum]|uniref:SMI1/KNR4 family protein n=1 Tax=Flavobacterium eburneipallidum TaxID=3003263 RepID=UPI0022AC2E3C|nr:SMI1/KNR4 family protein [Flavobacterium eburneipallidum]
MLREKLLILEKVLVEKGNPIVNSMEEPKDYDELFELITNYKFSFSKDFIDFYLWKGGLKSTLLFTEEAFDCELTAFGNFFEIDGLLSFFTMERISKTLPYENKFLAFFLNSSGDRVIIDLKEKSKTFGKIFIFSPSITLSSKPMQIFDSVESMVDTIIECYQKEAYKISNGKLEIDYDLESEIAQAINPHSEFWD